MRLPVVLILLILTGFCGASADPASDPAGAPGSGEIGFAAEASAAPPGTGPFTPAESSSTVSHVSTGPTPPPGKKVEHHEPGMFDINWAIFVSQTLNFFVLLYILKRFLYKPINEILDQRRALITRNLHDAQDAKAVALSLKDELETRMGAIAEEAYRIRQNAVTDAQAAGQDIVAKAREDSERILLTAHREIIVEKQKAWVELRQEVVRLTLLASEKVIEKSLDDPTHHELIERTIQRLESTH
jgi:F-type H+-transporting ATPase subunit b